jgi:cation diffusion facilitator CzcD-associated flavoprotein CzcO
MRPGRPRVVVVGAGFGGLAAAVRLRREGIEDLLVLEKESAPGGTWHVNHYPGAETDAPSHLYCFSFAGFPWTRSHVRQPELRAYVDHLVRQYGLARVLRTGVTVRRIAWDDGTGEHVVTLADGRQVRADAVVSAVGLFAQPRLPELPGLDTFPGPVLHTARWDDDVDLAGRRVAVLGTGSSAAQVVPALAGVAERVVVLQGQPTWVLPKGTGTSRPASAGCTGTPSPGRPTGCCSTRGRTARSSAAPSTGRAVAPTGAPSAGRWPSPTASSPAAPTCAPP